MSTVFPRLIVLLVLFVGMDRSLAAERIRFAYPAKSLNFLPLSLGRDKGIYQSEGIDLELVLVTSPIQVSALTNGDLEFSGAQSQVMAGAARGLPVKAVAFLTTKPSFWLVAKPEIKSIAELKGKRIGITAVGSSTDTLARYLLSKNGVTPDKDVALFGTGTTSNILIALKAGSVDAGVLSPPFHATAQQMGYRIVAYFGDHVEQSLSGVGAAEKMIRDRQDTVKRVLRATLKSLRFVQQNSAETAQYIGKEWKVDRPLAEELYRSMLPAFSKDGGMDEKGIREGLSRETERIGLKEEIPLSRVLDLRLLKEVQKAL